MKKLLCLLVISLSVITACSDSKLGIGSKSSKKDFVRAVGDLFNDEYCTEIFEDLYEDISPMTANFITKHVDNFNDSTFKGPEGVEAYANNMLNKDDAKIVLKDYENEVSPAFDKCEDNYGTED